MLNLFTKLGLWTPKIECMVDQTLQYTLQQGHDSL